MSKFTEYNAKIVSSLQCIFPEIIKINQNNDPEMGIFDNVITFTMSEFGRTLTSNGNGSDHAWGGNTMVMGGKVDGGKIFGSFPSLEIDNNLDVGRGRLIPTLSNDEYFAELAIWLGVAPSDLSTIFPNIGNFYNTTSGEMPIGFINS